MTEKDDFWNYLRQIVDHRLEMAEFQIVHQMTWGVPCGPTLTMIPEEAPPTPFERYLRGN